MGTLNKVTAFILLSIFNINYLQAQCESLYHDGVSNIDSIIVANCNDIKKEFIVTDNRFIVFTILINELYPNSNHFNRNTDHAIVTTDGEMKAFKSFLLENEGSILNMLNDLNNSTFRMGKYEKIIFDDIQLQHAALLYFLNRNLGDDFLDFKKVCKYHMGLIQEAKLDKHGYKTMPSGNEYVFMLTLLGLTHDTYKWNHHVRYIDEYSLSMFDNWCKKHYDDENINKKFFEELCMAKLMFHLYLPD